ncbi:MAG: hybrid sensor histidine kinase/response regulator [Planctomycetota bacterium]
MDELDRYIRIFRDEALEHLDTLRNGLIQLEDPTPEIEEVTAEILRCAHTLKGSARMVGLAGIGNLSHKMEDVLKGLEKGRLVVSRDLVSLLLEVTDIIRDAVEAAVSGDPAPEGLEDLIDRVATASLTPGEAGVAVKKPVEPEKEAEGDKEDLISELEGLFGGEEDDGSTGAVPAQAPAPAPEPEKSVKDPVKAEPVKPATKRPEKSAGTARMSPGMETIRVDVKKLDNLTILAGELMINRIRVENKYFMAKELTRALVMVLEDQEGEAPLPQEEWLPMLQEKIRGELRGLVDELSRETQEMGSLVQELQSLTMDLRLLPVSTIFDAYHRTVRDLKTALGREVSLHVSGRETLLDKRILEEVNPALIHLIRNAVDHGIEPSEERLRRGKEAAGHIHLEAFNEGGNVVIRVRDDGGGMDAEAIRAKAVEKGIIGEEEAGELSKREALNLVFRYGFSTSPIITDLSGRGVGLNVVWEKVEDLKGNINIDTEPGRSTSVSLSFPPTYFTLKTLVVKVGPEIIALPSNFIKETRWIERRHVSMEGGRPVIVDRGNVFPFIDLGRFLGFPAEKSRFGGARNSVAIVRFRNEFLALRVDRILRFEEEVVKSSGPFLQNHPFVSGVTILRKGEPCFILNMYDVFKYAKDWRGGEEELLKGEEKKSKKRILVADDSITTRTLEKSILENAGYDVSVARDGQEALSMAQEGSYSLVVTDVEMPGLTGFELTETLKADVRYKDVPFVIVTSLARDEHKQRGIDVGAQAYIVKGTFDQRRLLDTVRSLIG